MKKTFNIDEQLLKEARAASGAATDTEAIRQGLRWLIRHAAYQRIKRFRGTESEVREVPRRREKPASRGRAA